MAGGKIYKRAEHGHKQAFITSSQDSRTTRDAKIHKLVKRGQPRRRDIIEPVTVHHRLGDRTMFDGGRYVGVAVAMMAGGTGVSSKGC
jgi:hypothetical protein